MARPRLDSGFLVHAVWTVRTLLVTLDNPFRFFRSRFEDFLFKLSQFLPLVVLPSPDRAVSETLDSHVGRPRKGIIYVI